MPRRSILSAAERESLLALPDTQDALIRHYMFSEPDLSLIRQRRGDANRLGVAVQLCLLRFPRSGPAARRCGADALCCNGSDGNCGSTRPVGRSMPSGRKPGANPCSNCGRIWAWSRSVWRTIGRRSMPQPTWPCRPTRALCWPTASSNPCGTNTSSCRRSMLSSASVPRRSPAPTGASTMLWPNHWRTRIAAASTSCSSAGTTARRPGWPGCASRPPSRIRGTCSNTSNASRRGRRSTCLPASSDGFTRTGCSRSPARVAR
jgi:hypothetical protein